VTAVRPDVLLRACLPLAVLCAESKVDVTAGATGRNAAVSGHLATTVGSTDTTLAATSAQGTASFTGFAMTKDNTGARHLLHEHRRKSEWPFMCCHRLTAEVGGGGGRCLGLYVWGLVRHGLGTAALHTALAAYFTHAL
jgi:hypothetical protein